MIKLYKQLFLLIGNPGSIDLLRQMGFDVFDDIIDHNRYDYICDWRQRIDTIHQILDELYGLNWDKIYKETYTRRKKNIELFFSVNPIKLYSEEVARRISIISGTTVTYNHSALKSLQKYHTMRA